MAFVRQTYAKFWFPGILVSESIERQVDSRDIEVLEVPDRAYGFYFYDVVEGSDEVLTFTSDELNRSGMYFLGGTVRNLAEVERDFPDNHWLIGNMRDKEWPNVIQTYTSSILHCQPFLDGDVVLEPSAVVTA